MLKRGTRRWVDAEKLEVGRCVMLVVRAQSRWGSKRKASLEELPSGLTKFTTTLPDIVTLFLLPEGAAGVAQEEGAAERGFSCRETFFCFSASRGGALNCLTRFPGYWGIEAAYGGLEMASRCLAIGCYWWWWFCKCLENTRTLLPVANVYF